AKGDPVLMFCRSGTRSAVTWALAMRQAGADADGLRAAGARAGYDLSRMPL
ncbi:MAG: beta-lactamase hydrolase domain-containing protein, partial [Brevundimonas sp.]